MRLVCPNCKDVVESKRCILLDPLGKDTKWTIVCPKCTCSAKCSDKRVWMSTVIADWLLVETQEYYTKKMRAEHGVFS